MDAGFRLDMLIEDCVVIENKSVEKLTVVHEAQILNYLRLRNGGLGFLINWNVKLIRDGLFRFKV
jgi:GxxExxY protein